MPNFNIEAIAWNKINGLVPTIIQHANTGTVLMLGYMNKAALMQTLATKVVTFFSRSRNELWVKGETSGNYLKLHSIALDCDQDSVLIAAYPEGPTCHLGTTSCFTTTAPAPWQILATVETTIAQREHDRPPNSYTATLFNQGLPRIAQKVGEEAVETVIAALTGDNITLCQELSDLVFHMLVLMRMREVTLADIYKVLLSRQ